MKPIYSYRHRTIRAQIARRIDHDGGAMCAETICLEANRWITAGTPWHLAHGDTADEYRGPAHPRCNIAESNRRNSARRHGGGESWHSRNW